MLIILFNTLNELAKYKVNNDLIAKK